MDLILLVHLSYDWLQIIDLLPLLHQFVYIWRPFREVAFEIIQLIFKSGWKILILPDELESVVSEVGAEKIKDLIFYWLVLDEERSEVDALAWQELLYFIWCVFVVPDFIKNLFYFNVGRNDVSFGPFEIDLEPDLLEVLPNCG